jgi:phosphomannomutase
MKMHRRDINNVVMLDMDGTITPPRKSISSDMIIILMDLCLFADIVIVSGSDINYIIEQCGSDIIRYGFASHVIIMPCNGTKVYKFDGEAYKEIFSASLIEELGEALYRKLIKGILRSQAHIMDKYDFDISGGFVSYRKSTLNWSIIGRDSSQELRNKFSNSKDNNNIRNDAINILKATSMLTEDDLNKIEFTLGGQTSIDIYPKGWDKTYALKHIDGKESWFIGDKCKPGENDYHIYEKLSGKSFNTTGPEDTEKIINIIIGILKDKNNK